MKQLYWLSPTWRATITHCKNDLFHVFPCSFACRILTYYITFYSRDNALQNFHSLKIREINKIIRELWQLIYKGEDIDSIEIESGPEEGAAVSKTTRSYNYRVVMRKGE
jgi:hypothetical protein